jgi:hypothetical protein
MVVDGAGCWVQATSVATATHANDRLVQTANRVLNP